MKFDDWIESNRAKFGSDYEILFAREVLPLVEGLVCDAVTVQYPFVDKDGKKRYCDFAVIESETVRLAVEIDGYDKRGTGTGMSHDDFLDWQRRQASLASQGWHVLRFANRDVRDYPERCAEHISQLLRRLRQEEGGKVEIVTIQSNMSEVNNAPAHIEEAKAPSAKSKTNYILFSLIVSFVLVGVVVWKKDSVRQADRLPQRADVLNVSVARDNEVNENLRPAKISYGTLDCRNPMDWSQAKNHVGEVATVVGPLLATKPRTDVSGSPLWLDVGGIFPSQNRFSIVVWGKNWPRFDTKRLHAEYWRTIAAGGSGVSICLKGRIDEYKGVPQIELQDLSQLKIFLR